MKKLLPLLLAVLLLMGCAPLEMVVEAADEIIEALPTEEPTPEPTPAPTTAPTPKPTIYIGDPIVYTGEGNDIVFLDENIGDKLNPMWVFEIEGNKADRHFAVTAYDKDGEYLDLLVNTTRPYSGVVYEKSLEGRMLEVQASGEWTITAKSIYTVPTLRRGETLTGSNDSVVLYLDGDASFLTASGNADGHYFSIWAHGVEGRELLLSTTDPYEGKSIIEKEPIVLAITAVGDWSITIN